MTKRENEIYDFLVENGVATEDEINLVRCIVSGSWEEIFNSIIYARTGYRSYEQLLDAIVDEVISEIWG